MTKRSSPTAATILELTKEIVAHQELTTLMITHNMNHAIAFGSRLLMMDAGDVVIDVAAAAGGNLLHVVMDAESDRALAYLAPPK